MPPRDPRIQLAGPLVVRTGGRDVAPMLPGPQGRAAFAYLVLHRTREVTRDELAEAVWPGGPPPAAGTALRALLSKLRAALGTEAVAGSGAVRLRLAPAAWVDVEAAASGVHDAESAVALGDDRRAWVAAHVALNIAARELLPGVDAPWLGPHRVALADVRLRALEALATAALRLGGPELDTALRAARAVIREAPLRETGHRLVVDALAARGNVAEALVAYDDARARLIAELGVAPGPALRAAHERALTRASRG